ncbi:salt stress protein, Slr1339 family [Rivularia sp. PCC 7116]|uniref:salt stress protein, Slr1339 family n=1 Tax=Rivularia sp. PCC 7116 TaxID=373994 RepID=UPI003529C71F
MEKELLEEERIKVEERKALQSKAEAWLKNLDTLSPEGLWFEKFAEGYLTSCTILNNRRIHKFSG